MSARTLGRPALRGGQRGFSLIELLIAGAVVAVAGLAGVAYVVRSTQHADHARDRIFARQKALSILAELRAYVEGGKGEVAADLDGFDDGLAQDATLSIAPEPNDPGAFVAPDHPLSGNVLHEGEWRWFRRITVQRFPGVRTRDLRICTVRVFRHQPRGPTPGDVMAEVSSVVRTIGDAYPTTQVHDVYLLALENVPGWWVYMDSIKPFIEATLTDLEARNPGLEFRAHWITSSGYGRDERYAPYTNETRSSTDNTPWSYVYPGRMPTGSAADRYYVPDGIRARMNRDGQFAPLFQNDYAVGEPYVDENGNGRRDPGESYTDADGDDRYDVGNTVPYALADMQNHAMRWPDENAKFAARVAAGLEEDDTPTWRLLLDRMIADPAAYHNAILINLHGELLPMPAVRNFSDAAKDPGAHPGWRVVAHPERLRPRRALASDVNSDAPRWRVHAYKTEFPTAEAVMTLREPFRDANKNGVYDAGDGFVTGAGGDDWNGNGRWDDAVPVTLDVVGADFTANVNGTANPSLLVKRLPGGVDADGDGAADPYQAFANATRYPEPWTDSNADGLRNVAEPWFDKNGNGLRDATEAYQELSGNAVWDATTEAMQDWNLNSRLDLARPAERFTDLPPANLRWDAADPYWDANGNGVRNGPTAPVLPWRGWIPATDDASAAARQDYVTKYGEPFKDVNSNGVWNAAEPFTDDDGDGVCDGGYARGEMWYDASYDDATQATVLHLHGTPLYCPETADGRGLDAAAGRLYDLEYVPSPMINTASASAPPFERDLYNATADVPKNTARWTVEVPLAQVRKSFESAPGANNGDAFDRVLPTCARLGADRTTGAMWPVANRPENLSKSYCWFHASPSTVPFSERYQFQGDPRHCPYADLDRYGLSSPNGYNWYFDNFATSGNYQARWPAFDPAVLGAGWLGRSEHDTPRFLQWLRTAVTKTEALYTTLTGFSYYYLSLGGDVGYDSANGFASSIPVDGTPYGLSNTPARYEDTITTLGNVSGWGRKLVRSANGTTGSIRSGGYWWSKPWIGELYQDSVWDDQWVPWGNLRAGVGAAPETYRLVPRGSVTTAQQPQGTLLASRYARLQEEGCTSLFNIGSSASTFHHQYMDATTGTLVGDGTQLAANYNFPVPADALISRPFSLATSGAGGVGPEFARTVEYPRYSANTVAQFYNHSSGLTGSSLVRLIEPGSARAGYVVVNGIDRTTESGSAFIARYSLLTLVHSFFAAGNWSGTALRPVKQLPRVGIVTPTIVTELTDPAAITVQWHVDWQRWDGLKYTTAYPATFKEQETDLVYVPLYSRDGGDEWLNMKDGSPATPGVLPWITGVGPDPVKTISDAGVGDQTYLWSTPKALYPEGTYLIRVDAFRRTEALHFAYHMEKIYVNR